MFLYFPNQYITIYDMYLTALYIYFTIVQPYSFKTTNDPLHPPHLVSSTLPIMHDSTDIKI